MLVLAAIVTDDRLGTAAMMAELFGFGADAALEVPHVWIGTEDEICADLQARRDRWGVSYYVLQGDACEAMAPVVQRLTGTPERRFTLRFSRRLPIRTWAITFGSRPCEHQ